MLKGHDTLDVVLPSKYLTDPHAAAEPRDVIPVVANVS